MQATVDCSFVFFFFNDTATTEIYTLSLHDALPICCIASATIDAEYIGEAAQRLPADQVAVAVVELLQLIQAEQRSEEHTSELQSHLNLVCRLLLEKKKKMTQHEAEICQQCEETHMR